MKKQLLAVVASGVISVTAVAQVVVPLGEDLLVIPLDKVSTSRPTTPPAPGPTGPAIDFSSFDFQMRDQRILTGFPIGHNLPKATNELFYNLELDGYGGLPFGSCLYRKETLGQTIGGITRNYSSDEQTYCVANENKDLMRVWGNRNPNLKNVLLKNMTIKNAFRTRNEVDGVIVKSGSGLPHTDTFQSFYTGNSKENPDWLVIQDTLIKNSDNSLMIHGGGRFKGAVYQNLETGCDQAFRADARERAKNDYRAYKSTNEAEVEEKARGKNPCSNSMNFASKVAAPFWLIEIQNTNRVGASNQNAPVIVIGSVANDGTPLRVTTRDANRKVITHPNVLRYATIEDALRLHARPPYIEMSCAGWKSPPRGCEARRGYLK